MPFTDIASAGNGGVATSAASGGAVSIGDVNSGGNAGNAIGVGDTWGGNVGVDGGSVGNSDHSLDSCIERGAHRSGIQRVAV